MFNSKKGISVRDVPEANIHGWMDPQSPNYNSVFAQAIFHYSARAEKQDRFEACVATNEMKDAAWKHGHRDQIILDGTFGVSDRRLLLFIIMVVDDERKGIPVAFLFFSAPTGNKQSSAGYNTDILTKLLSAWKNDLKQYKPGQEFEPVSAITDTDMKERAALLNVFLDIVLLICRFHLRQSWRNHRNTALKGDGQVLEDLRMRMIILETALPRTHELVVARKLISDEREILQDLKTDHPSEVNKATGYQIGNMPWDVKVQVSESSFSQALRHYAEFKNTS
ncbi:unnamed protein product [Mycena citricolor]|uniref:MULE transposase domain-containing protein n=1 Tax=Mycena citricolor TaxID=2018698 RepID=A0AAD2K4U3_9AGAR|nr:unnamed protein product [Mycena citricolor]